jgi:prophage antirepressor-like protein
MKATMMSDLLNFNFNQQSVQVELRDGEPWFVATDFAEILGYRDAPNMVRMLDHDEQQDAIVSRLEGKRTVKRPLTIISESGLYQVIFRSERPEALPFRKWVTGTVLPQIRRTGAYAPAGPPPRTLEEQIRGPETSYEVMTRMDAYLRGRDSVNARAVALALRLCTDARTLQLVRGMLRTLGWILIPHEEQWVNGRQPVDRGPAPTWPTPSQPTSSQGTSSQATSSEDDQ